MHVGLLLTHLFSCNKLKWPANSANKSNVCFIYVGLIKEVFRRHRLKPVTQRNDPLKIILCLIRDSLVYSQLVRLTFFLCSKYVKYMYVLAQDYQELKDLFELLRLKNINGKNSTRSECCHYVQVEASRPS